MNTTEEATKKIVSYVGWLLLAAATIFYLYAMTEAIRHSIVPPPPGKTIEYPEFLSTTMSSIQALLLANLGIVLGISVSQPNTPVARALFLSNADKTLTPTVNSPLDVKSQIQLVGLVIYIVGLIVCLVVLATKKFAPAPNTIVPVVQDSAKMFVGVVLAYLSVVFTRETR